MRAASNASLADAPEVFGVWGTCFAIRWLGHTMFVTARHVALPTDGMFVLAQAGRTPPDVDIEHVFGRDGKGDDETMIG